MAQLSTFLGIIGFDEQGTGDSLPIVFLHGVGSDKSVWRRQLDHFGASRRAVAFDYPGYGESEPVDSDSHYDFALSILSAMDALGIAQAHICGLSLGGVIAIAMHAAAPDRCGSLILADTFAEHPEGAAIYHRSLEASRDPGMRALAEGRVGALLTSQDPDLRSEVIETMSRIDPLAYRIGAHEVWLADQSDSVGAIAVPTLVIVGEDDQITPPDLSRELHNAIPGSRLELIANASHLANLDQPQEFNRLVEDFIAAVDRG